MMDSEKHMQWIDDSVERLRIQKSKHEKTYNNSSSDEMKKLCLKINGKIDEDITMLKSIKKRYKQALEMESEYSWHIYPDTMGK